MKPVIKKEDVIAYVSDADMIEFISENAPMEWNKCCDYVRDNGITGSEGKVYWTKDILKRPKLYNEQQVKWITAFFDTHPWIEKFMCVFDD
jgi:hypothetical protein